MNDTCMADRLCLLMTIALAVGLALQPTPATAEFPARELERLRAVPYVQRGDEELLADVYMPPGEGPYPGVLMVHGGAWMAGSKWTMLRHANQLAQEGYTAVAINYRLAPKHKFPAQLDDCREAVRWMRRNAKKYKIDPQRIAAYGYSAGGHLSALLGVTGNQGGAAANASAVAEAEDEGEDAPFGRGDARVQAVVAGGAPCDFSWLPPESQSLKYFLGGSRRDVPERYRQASPLAHATRDDPPFFLFHGAKDRLVPRVSPTLLAERLRELGVAAEMHIVPESGHLATFSDANTRRLALEFLDQTFKTKPANP